MSVTSLRLVIPLRAGWWLQHLAIREKMSADAMVLAWTLERLHATPGVDLLRYPSMTEQSDPVLDGGTTDLRGLPY